MNKSLACVVAALMGAVTIGAFAQDATDKPMPQAKFMPMHHDMKMMDTDHDGSVSKEDWMTYHEAMWDKMKKDANGNFKLAPMGLPSDRNSQPK